MISKLFYFPGKVLKGLVVSDPLYDAKVKCQYRRKVFPFQTGLDAGRYVFWNIDTVEDGVLQLDLVVGRLLNSRPELCAVAAKRNTDEGGFSLGTVSWITNKRADVEIGVDTAHLFVGSHEMFTQWGECGSIATGGDGFFGTAAERFITSQSWGSKFKQARCPFDEASTWVYSMVTLYFDAGLISPERLDGQLKATFGANLDVVKEIPVEISDEWLSLPVLVSRSLG